ncbi:short-chain dehydrogenase [Apiospora arundinis]
MAQPYMPSGCQPRPASGVFILDMHVFVSRTLKIATNVRKRRRPTCLIEDSLRESVSKSEDIKIPSWHELRAALQGIRIALLCRREADPVKLPVFFLFIDSLSAQRNASDAQTGAGSSTPPSKST